MIVDQLPEQTAVHVLAHEALDFANAVDRLGQGRRDATEALLLSAVGLAQFAAKMPNNGPQNRRHGGHDEEQLPVVVDHEASRHDQVAELHRADEGDVLHTQTHCVHVRGHAPDQPADLRALEVAHW